MREVPTRTRVRRSRCARLEAMADGERLLSIRLSPEAGEKWGILSSQRGVRKCSCRRPGVESGGVVREGAPAWCSGFSLVARATSLSASVARLSRISSRFDTKKTEAEGCLHEETSI